jgi:hypothetical protein
MIPAPARHPIEKNYVCAEIIGGGPKASRPPEMSGVAGREIKRTARQANVDRGQRLWNLRLGVAMWLSWLGQ